MMMLVAGIVGRCERLRIFPAAGVSNERVPREVQDLRKGSSGEPAVLSWIAPGGPGGTVLEEVGERQPGHRALMAGGRGRL